MPKPCKQVFSDILNSDIIQFTRFSDVVRGRSVRHYPSTVGPHPKPGMPPTLNTPLIRWYFSRHVEKTRGIPTRNQCDCELVRLDIDGINGMLPNQDYKIEQNI